MGQQTVRRGIFISYRRQETSAFAGRLYERLASHFGVDQIFMDVDSIQPGMDFVEVIERAVASCQVILVLIGDDWLTGADQQGRRRIDHPDDYVRLEIEAALKHQVRLIPLLVDGATLPSQTDLPDSLRALVRRQALIINHERFRAETQRLITVLETLLDGGGSPQETARPPEEPIRPPREPVRPSQPEHQLNFPSPKNLVFVSYSHKDENYLERLQVHLKPLARHGRIQLWDDTQIMAGDEWRNEIKAAIESCRAAILLISADFMASDFVYTDELPPLLSAARSRGVRILPIIVSASSFEDSELGRFQAVNSPSKPLDMLPWGEQQLVFVGVYRAVRDTLRS